jgi:proteasome activator subunit 4
MILPKQWAMVPFLFFRSVLNTRVPQLCTTAFLIEISQSIKFGDLTQEESVDSGVQLSTGGVSDQLAENLPELILDDIPHKIEPGEEPCLSKTEEDALLRESTRGFPDWVASFIRRVILLFENLPEDTGGEVRSGGESEST